MAIHRRGFLEALALVPAALAGCAGERRQAAKGSGPVAATGPGAPERRAGAPVTPRLAALRDHPLRADAEPALVFRAGAARPGEP